MRLSEICSITPSRDGCQARLTRPPWESGHPFDFGPLKFENSARRAAHQ